MKRFEHLTLRLVDDGEVEADLVAREFPGVTIERVDAAGPADVLVEDRVWRGAFDLGSLDEQIERAAPRVTIAIRGYDVVGIACEIATRWQRRLDRRNDASRSPLFDRVLAGHLELYAPFTPAAVAEHDHALDAWQWVLRLAPDAGLPLQIAALVHDLERLEADERERIEHRVPDGQTTKDAAALRAAARATATLEAAGVSADQTRRVHDIVFAAERRADPEVLLLDDADALSFLSLASAQYIDYFGVAQTRRKVAYTVSRLGPAARARLDRVRLRPDVERLVREVAA